MEASLTKSGEQFTLALERRLSHAPPRVWRLLFSETLEDASWGARNAAGWEYCLENLETILQGAAAARFVMDGWQGRFEHYVSAFQAKFGPQQGPPETQSARNAIRQNRRVLIAIKKGLSKNGGEHT